MTISTLKKRTVLLACILGCLSLAGCVDRKDPVDSMQGMKAAREARLSTAASEAMAAGRTEEALALYKKRYADRPEDRVGAVNYAQLLRKTGRAPEAADILAGFVTRSETDPLLLNEYAATLIEIGEIEKAGEILDTVLADNTAKAFHADARNLKGVLLAGQNRHAEAEIEFRQAWEGWKGDATSVMNNLGLAQANQQKFTDALNTLRWALALNPAKKEIARNIQIVTDMQAKVTPKKPVSVYKKSKTDKPAAKKSTKAAAKKDPDSWMK